MKKLFILTAFVIGAMTSKAQIGSDCFNPQPLGQGDTCVYDISVAASEYWLSFVADSSFVTISIGNDPNPNIGHVHGISIYEGTCNNLSFVASARINPPNDTISLDLQTLIPGNIYYIVCKTAIPVCSEQRCNSTADFDICINNFSAQTSCNSPLCPITYPQCEWICNGDFEYYTSCPTGFVQLYK